MKQTKQTRRALSASMLSVVLCAGMLIGTTFAWFTDSVTCGRNQIVAGNLDVELEYATVVDTQAGTLSEWKTVQDATDLFADGLWEPGYAQVVYLRVENLGTLAVKYQLSVNIDAQTPGVNVAGEEFLLSDYLQYGMVKGQQTSFATRADAIAAVGNPVSLDTYTQAGNLLAGADPEYLALVVYMPETVGNEANYRGQTAPKIELGVNLVATQDTVESDSFDNQYDVSAAITTESALKDALENGGSIMLFDNIVLTQDVNITKDVTVDLNGNTLSIDTLELNAGNATFTNGTIVTEDNFDKIDIRPGANVPVTLQISDVKFVNERDHGNAVGSGVGNLTDDVLQTYTGGNGGRISLIVENCTFINESFSFNYQDTVDAVFRDCTFDNVVTNNSVIRFACRQADAKLTVQGCTFDVVSHYSNDIVINGTYEATFDIQNNTATMQSDGTNTYFLSGTSRGTSDNPNVTYQNNICTGFRYASGWTR